MSDTVIKNIDTGEYKVIPDKICPILSLADMVLVRVEGFAYCYKEKCAIYNEESQACGFRIK